MNARHLNSAMLRRLQEALAVVAEAPDGLNSTAEVAVEQLQLLVPCESAVLGYRRASDGAYFGFWRPVSYPVNQLGEIYHQHVGEHPFVQHFRENAGAPAVRFSDLISHRELRNRAIYRDFFGPLGTHHLLGRVVPVADLADWNFGAADNCFRYATNAAVYKYTTVSLAVGRSQRDFTDAEAEAFDLFVRHVTAQFMRELRWELACRRANANANASTAAATSSLAGPATNVIAPTAASTANPAVPPADAAKSASAEASHPAFELFSGRVSPAAINAVAQQFRLTAREQEVLGWVCAGKTNPEIATIFGTSPRTVQTQMQSILEKLGVETRLAAARMVWDQPARALPKP